MVTDGQQRVRAIITDLAPYWEVCRTSEDKEILYASAKRIFCDDPMITTDPITARRLGYFDTAENYLYWLGRHSQQKNYRHRRFAVSLDRFVYNYAHKQQQKIMPSYNGGVKWRTTFEALFTFSQQKKIPVFDMNARYYYEDGILTICDGGNHRLLAHVLWGSPRLQTDFIQLMFNGKPDQALNRALLTIEHVFQSSSGTWFRLTEFTDHEADLVKALAAELEQVGGDVFQTYLCYLSETLNQRWNIIPYTIWYLLSELKRLRGESSLTRMYNAVRRRFTTPLPESSFEYWYHTFGSSVTRRV
jgi:hypothetical protein